MTLVDAVLRSAGIGLHAILHYAAQHHVLVAIVAAATPTISSRAGRAVRSSAMLFDLLVVEAASVVGLIK